LDNRKSSQWSQNKFNNINGLSFTTKSDGEGIQIKNLNTWCIKKKGWMRPFA